MLTANQWEWYIKTKRNFGRRIQDHLYFIEGGLLYTPICKLVGLRHHFDPSVITFFVLERIFQNSQGCDFDKQILKQETKWIYNQKETSHPGLNTALTFKPFL